MAEDIRDMSIMGYVYEFRKQAKADAYILRNGTVLDDKIEMFSVGGYTRVFSLEHNEPALGIRSLDNEDSLENNGNLFYLDESSDRWSYVENEIPSNSKIAEAIDKDFLAAVNSHWIGTEYKTEPYSFGHTLVFRNGIDVPKLGAITEGDVTVKRFAKDGSIRYYWPKGSKMFKG